MDTYSRVITTAREAFDAFWASRDALGWIAVAVALPVFLLLIALWIGHVPSACIMGIFVVLMLRRMYVEVEKAADLAGRAVSEGKVHFLSDRRLLLLVMAVIASVTCLLCNIAVYSLGDSTADFGDFWVRQLLVLGAPLTLAAAAFFRGHTPEAPGLPGAGIMFFRGFYLASAFAVFFCGLWGVDAFQAASKIAYFRLDDWWPWSSERMASASLLLQTLGKVPFYAAFGLVPAVWLLLQMPEAWRVFVRHQPGNLFGKGLLLVAWILPITLTAAAYAGDLDPIYYDALGLGHTIDRELYACQKSAPDQNATLDCYTQATAKWRDELAATQARVRPKLDTESLGYLDESDNGWNNTVVNDLTSLGQLVANEPDGKLIIAKQRLKLTRERALYLQDAYSPILR